MKEELKEQKNLNGEERKKRLSIFKKKEIWISGIIGIIIGAIIIYILSMFGIFGFSQDKIVATFKGGKVTKNELYDELSNYQLNYALEIIDEAILGKKYELTQEQKDEILNEAESVLAMYEMYYGYTEETFLSENGFDTKDDFIAYMEFDYKRNLACLDYFKALIPTEDIEKYYNENITIGEINTKHILVEISEEVTDEQALKQANEIISKLNNGTNFDDIATEYADSVISEEVDFDSFSESTFAESYVVASKNLEKDSYTKEPVKTDYGYHIIYCVNKNEKPSLQEVENKIIEVLAEQLEAEDQYIRYKALIKIREENNLKFKDKDLQEDYNEYCQKANETINE